MAKKKAQKQAQEMPPEYTITRISNELVEQIVTLVVERTITRLDELIKARQEGESEEEASA